MPLVGIVRKTVVERGIGIGGCACRFCCEHLSDLFAQSRLRTQAIGIGQAGVAIDAHALEVLIAKMRQRHQHRTLVGMHFLQCDTGLALGEIGGGRVQAIGDIARAEFDQVARIGVEVEDDHS